jgi:hypothetical protein
LIGFVAATVLEYWIFTHVLWADLDSQRHIALILGTIAMLGGSLWIAGLGWTAMTDRRTMWLALTGPLGAMQLFAGLGLLLWVAGFERLKLISAVAATGSLCLFVSLLIWPGVIKGGRE